ncbi:MAG: DUF1566 domain-containing protein, partial [Alphaproteobacteria bacterium]|nr:DUF1566 domain-containing protein [Alphaproteobacteria bacterium]
DFSISSSQVLPSLPTNSEELCCKWCASDVLCLASVLSDGQCTLYNTTNVERKLGHVLFLPNGTVSPMPTISPAPTSIPYWSFEAYADATSQSGRYIVQGVAPNALVLDTYTNLMWEQTVGGSNVTWSAAAASGSAQAYCANLENNGYTDWHVPTIRQLQSLVDYTIDPESPINSTAFPQTPSANFWTSFSDAAYPNQKWQVCFGNYGYIGPNVAPVTAPSLALLFAVFVDQIGYFLIDIEIQMTAPLMPTVHRSRIWILA